MSASGIGTLGEKRLHAALKQWYARPGDVLERELDGYVIDIYRDDLLIEIQTRNLGALRPKLTYLLGYYPVHLVHPIASEKTIVRVDAKGRETGRRLSPRRGIPADILSELMGIRDLVMHPNLTMEVLMVRLEEFRRLTVPPGRRRRPCWVVQDRNLLEVEGSMMLASYSDFRGLLPADLPTPFTVADLADRMGRTRHQAGGMAYVLRRMGVIREVGKRRNAILYA